MSTETWTPTWQGLQCPPGHSLAVESGMNCQYGGVGMGLQVQCCLQCSPLVKPSQMRSRAHRCLINWVLIFSRVSLLGSIWFFWA